MAKTISASAMRDRLLAGKTGHGWDDIKTAPKDRPFLAVGEGYDTPQVVKFRLGKLVATWDHDEFTDATHWKPLGPDPWGQDYEPIEPRVIVIPGEPIAQSILVEALAEIGREYEQLRLLARALLDHPDDGDIRAQVREALEKA
jgi:hypothetical protein